MNTRWLFHRLQMPLAGVPHFDMPSCVARAADGRIKMIPAAD
jgi:hypothetical protein